jgi:hypothetical protein
VRHTEPQFSDAEEQCILYLVQTSLFAIELLQTVQGGQFNPMYVASTISNVQEPWHIRYGPKLQLTMLVSASDRGAKTVLLALSGLGILRFRARSCRGCSSTASRMMQALAGQNGR